MAVNTRHYSQRKARPISKVSKLESNLFWNFGPLDNPYYKSL